MLALRRTLTRLEDVPCLPLSHQPRWGIAQIDSSFNALMLEFLTPLWDEPSWLGGQIVYSVNDDFMLLHGQYHQVRLLRNLPSVAWCDQLRQSPDSRHLPLLILALNSKNDELCAAAADAIAVLREKASSAEGPLLDVLLDPSRPVFVRDTAAYALGRIGASGSLEILNGIAANANDNVGKCAARAIEDILDAK